LRPEGRQGPLTRSAASYAAYYRRWSALWEAQALLRASHLAGDADISASFLADIDDVRWPTGGLTNEQVVEIRRIKARVENERMPKNVDTGLALKMGKGGIADVEWTVQLLQLRHAHEVEGLRTTSTLAALRAAVEAGLVEPADGDVLATAWTLAVRVRNALLLVRGRPAAALPSSGRELAGVARALRYPAGASGTFLDDYRRATRRSRAVVERVFYQ
jgi:glutamate-ammonia-ligase adenylyltransferase